ncbi:MAG: SEL1-like repeat protein [Verrucomicrobia subdivision 3 bacterium]|nr:SEL1-like repeat protein [Limisphaerales bacterium]
MRILDNLIFRAEELNEVKIQYRLAVIYQTGDRTEQNLEQARHWFERAAEQGHEDAARILATLGGSKKNPGKLETPRAATKAKVGAVAEVALPPVIKTKPLRQAKESKSDSAGQGNCPNGHGPLQDWDGDLRCWICGWSHKQSSSPGRSTVGQPVNFEGAMGGTGNTESRLMRWFGKKPEPRLPVEETNSGEAKSKEPGFNLDAVFGVGVVLYLLARSC